MVYVVLNHDGNACRLLPPYHQSNYLWRGFRPLFEDPFEAAFLAGKCFLEYRRRGGIRASTLPDFFIGAHAAVAGYRIITRDGARYRTYFPKLVIVAPP
jgi:predicted nucleic acid-binding protein